MSSHLAGGRAPDSQRNDFGEGGVDREAVEVDHGRVRGAGAVAVQSVERLLVGGFGPSGDFGGVELVEAGEAGPAGQGEHDATAERDGLAGFVEAGRDVDVRGPGVNSDLVKSVPGSVVVDTADDQVDVVEFGVVAGGCKAGQGTHPNGGVDGAHSTPRHDGLRAVDIGEIGGDQPVEVAGFDEIVIEDQHVPESEVREAQGDMRSSATATDNGNAHPRNGGLGLGAKEWKLPVESFARDRRGVDDP